MKALSLWQPWAHAIFCTDDEGIPIKPDETRGWPANIRGRIAIHAAKKPVRTILADFPQLRTSMICAGIDPDELVCGAILGTVEIADCVPAELAGELRETCQTHWGDYRRFGDDGKRRYAFALRNPVPLKTPLYFTGRQGFFEVALTNELFVRWKSSGLDEDRNDYDEVVSRLKEEMEAIHAHTR